MTKMYTRRRSKTAIIVAALLTLAAAPAQAYVGPGAGLSAIGTLIALLATLFLAVVGFVWYPLKRVFRKSRQASADKESHFDRPREP